MVGGQYLASRWKPATHTTAPASFGQGWYEGQRAPAQGRHHIAANILKSRAHFRAFFCIVRIFPLAMMMMIVLFIVLSRIKHQIPLGRVRTP